MGITIKEGTLGSNDYEYTWNGLIGHNEDSKVFMDKSYGATGDRRFDKATQSDLANIYNSNSNYTYRLYKFAFMNIKCPNPGDSRLYLYANIAGKIQIISLFDYSDTWMYYVKESSIGFYTGLPYSHIPTDNISISSVIKSSANYFECESNSPYNISNTLGYQNMVKYLAGTAPSHGSNDPYKPGGSSGSGGGTGSFDRDNDDVSIPNLPTLSAVDSGFITVYSPTLDQLKALASYMWSTNFTDIINKLFADPMDTILGLNVLPISIPTTSSTVKVGNVDTQVVMNKASSQYFKVNCGSLTLNEYWGSYLDYSPYTKVDLFLPFIGTVPLDTDAVMGKNINVTYHIDIVSGACVAYILVNGVCLYNFTGNCASSVPVTSQSFDSTVSAALNVAGLATSGAALIATGGMTAPLAASSIVSSANTIANSKPSIAKSGSCTGSAGMLSVMYPYLIVEYPNQCLPSNQNVYSGYPSYVTAEIGTLTGYTEIEKCHLENMTCTDSELNEIYELLESGVIL